MAKMKDVVCGREATDTRFGTTYGDRPFYFCSLKCEMDFAGNPMRYVETAHSASSTAGSPKILGDGLEVPSKI